MAIAEFSKFADIWLLVTAFISKKQNKQNHTKVNMVWFSKKTKKQKQKQKHIYFCFIDFTRAFDCVDHNKLWKILKRQEY